MADNGKSKADQIGKYEDVRKTFEATDAFEQQKKIVEQSSEYQNKAQELDGSIRRTRQEIADAKDEWERKSAEIALGELLEKRASLLDEFLNNPDFVENTLAKISEEESASIDKSVTDFEENLRIQREGGLIGHRWDSTESGFIELLGKYGIVELDFRSAIDGSVASHPSILREDKRKDTAFVFRKKEGNAIATRYIDQLKADHPDLLTLEKALEIFDRYEGHEFVVDVKDEGVSFDLIELVGKGKRFEHLQNRLRISVFDPKSFLRMVEELPNIKGFTLYGLPLTKMDLGEEAGHKSPDKISGIFNDPQLEALGKDIPKCIFSSTPLPSDEVDRIKSGQKFENYFEADIKGAVIVATLLSVFSEDKAKKFLAKTVEKYRKQGMGTYTAIADFSPKLQQLFKSLNPEARVKLLRDARVGVLYIDNPKEIAEGMRRES